MEAMSREAKYRLDFDVPGAADLVTRSSSDYQTLAGALVAGWVVNTFGGRPLGVTYGGLPVMREEDLQLAFDRLHATASDCPGENDIGRAARVLREMGLE